MKAVAVGKGERNKGTSTIIKTGPDRTSHSPKDIWALASVRAPEHSGNRVSEWKNDCTKTPKTCVPVLPQPIVAGHLLVMPFYLSLGVLLFVEVLHKAAVETA